MREPYVGILHITKDGSVMLQKRDNKPGIESPGQIATFGGGVENDETLEETAIREAKEELGLEINPEQLSYFGKIQLSKEVDGKDQSCHFFLLHGTDPSKIVVKEGRGYVLVSKGNFRVKQEKMAKFTRDILTRYFEKGERDA